MRIHFLGGIDTVTGSQCIVESNGINIMRDCGMFQGRRSESRKRNRELSFNPDEISSVVLSHAHIDHVGNLPTLAKYGFNKPIYATSATVEIAEIMLRDAAHIQEQDAFYLNQKTNRKGFRPVEPLYTAEDAEAIITCLKGCQYGDTLTLSDSVKVDFMEAGHILGAALNIFHVTENGRSLKVAFAVDLGRNDLPLIRDPEVIQQPDVLVLESTYGNRLHDDAADAKDELKEAVLKAINRNGKVLIPSFALERAQEIVYHLTDLIYHGELPQIPVYVDSPMATEVTKVFRKNMDYMDSDAVKLKKLAGSILNPKWVHLTSSVEESKKITASDEPSIVISASGMCEHGRILHHLKHGVENPANVILIVGYQAQHTLGRRLVEKQKRIRIFGDTFDRRADVCVLNAFSAHADRNELLEYVRLCKPKSIYLVHGEPKQRRALAKGLKAAGIQDVFMPKQGEVVEL